MDKYIYHSTDRLLQTKVRSIMKSKKNDSPLKRIIKFKNNLKNNINKYIIVPNSLCELKTTFVQILIFFYHSSRKMTRK